MLHEYAALSCCMNMNIKMDMDTNTKTWATSLKWKPPHGHGHGHQNSHCKRYSKNAAARYISAVLLNASSLWRKVIASDSYHSGNIRIVFAFNSGVVIASALLIIVLGISELLVIALKR